MLQIAKIDENPEIDKTSEIHKFCHVLSYNIEEKCKTKKKSNTRADIPN